MGIAIVNNEYFKKFLDLDRDPHLETLHPIVIRIVTKIFPEKKDGKGPDCANFLARLHKTWSAKSQTL